MPNECPARTCLAGEPCCHSPNQPKAEKPTSTILRDLASIRDRVIKEKDAEYTADRWVLWGDVIDAVNALERDVFAIVRYDESKPMQFTPATCPGRPCGSECTHRGRM